ncbi:ADP-ribose pyrophosphatase YjhB (NUDIX family) [Anaerosolibacter carboniphilus]|uniref:ADP-ribose pyrophosphatase YjhB (NUDIX family) n=1 Tax=Anaerosolibacter carboniphilus TaxID=1417629 RepID=A0A841KRS8_9FIRM|nr:NUDIX domain-containing protein [Anaerosolibacter carboniphilus]MBB6216266.1 ADP-ribose pyrophosphatase YjhB (NUDIX family) [Anaerosolibacter carboniphilus]
MDNHNFIGVGGLLYHHNQYLLVKHTYGEYKGQWILPGGHVNPGEHIDDAIVREFKEETALDVHPRSVLALRSRKRSDTSLDCYIIFLLEYLDGQPASDNLENDAARFFCLEEINSMDNIIELSKIIINEFHAATLKVLEKSTTYSPQGMDPETLRLYL